MTKAQSNFISTVAGAIKTGKILKSLIISQAILESGWGKHHIHHNYFGIKAHSGWTGKVYNAKTHEIYDGVRHDITADFRAYNNLAESVADYEQFILGVSRYKAVIGEKDYKKACKAIHSAGYATAPNYADTLISLIEQYKLYEYDKAQEVKPVVKPIISQSKTYTVKKGDSFWAIAQSQLKNGSRYKEIIKLNSLTEKSVIHAGQVLKIPDDTAQSKPATYKYGDNVRVVQGAKDYAGGGLAKHVYSTLYTVLGVTGDRVVIGIGSQITAAMRAQDIYKA